MLLILNLLLFLLDTTLIVIKKYRNKSFISAYEVDDFTKVATDKGPLLLS